MLSFKLLDLRESDKFWAFGCNVARSLARVTFAVAVARLAGVQDYSIYVQLLAAEVIALAIVQSLAVAPLITLAPGRAQAEVHTLSALALRRVIRCCGLIVLTGLLAVPVLARFGISPIVGVGFAMSTAGWSVASLARGWSSLTFRSRRAFLADAAGLATVGLGLAVGHLTGAGILAGYFWAGAIGSLVVVFGIGLPRVPLALASRASGPASDFAWIARPMALGSAANSIGSRTQPFVLGAFGGIPVVGSFGAASTLIGPLRLMSMALGNVLRPRMSLHFNHGRSDRLRTTLALSVGGLLLAGCGLFLAFLLFGDRIGALVFGAGFDALGVVLIWGAVYATLEGIGSTFVIVLQTTRRDGASVATRLRTTTTVLGLALLGPACARYGATGAFAVSAVVEALFLAGAFWSGRAVLASGSIRKPRSAPEAAAARG
jgi:O-antigen/teichoic acid export membrane protein